MRRSGSLSLPGRAGLAALALLLLAHPSQAQSAKVLSETTVYRSWTVVCDADGCGAFQLLYNPDNSNLDKDGKPGAFARIDLLRRDGKPVIRLAAPFNTALEFGMVLVADREVIKPVSYETCRQACMGSTELDETLSNAMHKAGRVEVGISDLTGNAIYLVVSMDGFDDAVKALSETTAETSEGKYPRPVP